MIHVLHTEYITCVLSIIATVRLLFVMERTNYIIIVNYIGRVALQLSQHTCGYPLQIYAHHKIMMILYQKNTDLPAICDAIPTVTAL